MVEDLSGWTQPPLIPKSRRGRPKSPDRLVFKTIGLTADQWQWLDSWLPGGSPTAQIRELFARALKFWPAGPGRFR